MIKLMTALTGMILLSSSYAFGGEDGCPGNYEPTTIRKAIRDTNCKIDNGPSCSWIETRDKNGDGTICIKFNGNKFDDTNLKDNTQKN